MSLYLQISRETRNVKNIGLSFHGKDKKTVLPSRYLGFRSDYIYSLLIVLSIGPMGIPEHKKMYPKVCNTSKSKTLRHGEN